ncbi:MAG TPA: hypothetical protein P5055_04205 [Candidatus Paceibacterota bacterium]|nr:hypothetical protein [Candidatus Paceibacterota bacterium]
MDTLIAFATIMLGVSLLITVFTQIISSILGLRGTNLRWGVQKLLETAVSVPTNKAKNPALESEIQKQWRTVVDRILHHPLISDSTFSKFGGGTPFRGWIERVKLAHGIRKEELLNLLDVPGDFEGADAVAEALKKDSDKVKLHIERWFDQTMDRVSQRFAMSMRMYTIALAVVLVAGLQLDAIGLLKKISQDAVMRSRLVASADTVVRETSKVFGPRGDTNVFMVSLDQLKKSDPGAREALTNAPPSLMTLELAHLWIRTQVNESTKKEKILDQYDALVATNLVAKVPELMGSVAVVQDELAKAGLTWLPARKSVQMSDYDPRKQGFWGMLISVALLSLGAPFWFNALNTLLSLRPILSTRMDKEAKAQSKNPK